MSLYQKAKSVLVSGNLLQALELFELSYKNGQLQGHEALNTLYEIKNLITVLKKNKDPAILSFLAEGFEKERRLEEAILFYQQLTNISPKKSYYIKTIDLCLLEGNIKLARTAVENYICFLVGYRDFGGALDFLQSRDKTNALLDEDSYTRWKLLISIKIGNIEDVERIIEKPSIKKSYTLCKLFIDNTSHASSFWHSSAAINNWLLSCLVDHDLKSDLTKKKVVKLLIDSLLLCEIDHELIDKLIQIAKHWSLNNFGYELAKCLGDRNLEDYFVVRIPKGQMLSDNYDLGLDLISDRSLLDKANFSLAVGDTKSAANYINKIDDVELLNDLRSVVSRKEESSKVSVDYNMGFVPLVSYYEDDYLMEHYEDLIISFNMMRLFDVSLEVIERVMTSGRLNESIELNVLYLKVETLIGLGKYFEARDLVEDILSSHILSKDERLLFNYLRGECYYYLGQYQRSYKIFLSIRDKTKGYRLTEEWIGKIEKGQ